jgi:predicted metal-dependent hydrolase
MNHSPRFGALVRCLVPYMDAPKIGLNKNGRDLQRYGIR